MREYEIISNRRLTHKTWVMILGGDTAKITAPGQFVNIAIPGLYLRRPISICDYSHVRVEITLLYDVVGEGTREMSQMKAGTKLNILSGLGNGFSTSSIGSSPLLLGGGIGCAPLMALARTLRQQGKNPVAILGFNTAADSFGMERWFDQIGVEAYVATVDGSLGTKGFVTDVIREKKISGDHFYACGPMPMLKALCQGLEMPGEVSIESRMGCGFGACMCCSVETADGAKRICKDGPVFRKEELIWK
ncbi:MAG: dihydroorotate dehydrogenase electron transfer subunit [Muribaculaceae bacterium]|nr:dihydroorotate dehydrogenase electron transfer subunit [Muribaculaceae bacterium]